MFYAWLLLVLLFDWLMVVKVVAAQQGTISKSYFPARYCSSRGRDGVLPVLIGMLADRLEGAFFYSADLGLPLCRPSWRADPAAYLVEVSNMFDQAVCRCWRFPWAAARMAPASAAGSQFSGGENVSVFFDFVATL
ncbi:hypothetical protein [Marinobacterium arenosum]|uniref:hypothetical protein n=1 Tax=Marinobacterium arenosum TaxID=2862496 RepID=UPI001C968EF4|nr:hypothetical protein [Marinobacterium arenosum]MBY4676652.1 hypothetical protein [Marinobacterium arenosum]